MMFHTSMRWSALWLLSAVSEGVKNTLINTDVHGILTIKVSVIQVIVVCVFPPQHRKTIKIFLKKSTAARLKTEDISFSPLVNSISMSLWFHNTIHWKWEHYFVSLNWISLVATCTSCLRTVLWRIIVVLNNVCFVNRNGYYRRHSINITLAYSLFSFTLNLTLTIIMLYYDSRLLLATLEAYRASAFKATHTPKWWETMHTHSTSLRQTGGNLLQLIHAASKEDLAQLRYFHHEHTHIHTKSSSQHTNSQLCCRLIKVRSWGWVPQKSNNPETLAVHNRAALSSRRKKN